MKKRKIFKAILLIGCLGVCVASGLAFTGCQGGDDNGVSFVEEEKKSGPQFLEGSLADVEVGATVVLSEYIDYVTDSTYQVTITDEDGTVIDVTNEIIWIAEQPGISLLSFA